MPDRVLQMQHPTLYCMHAATGAAGAGKTLKFNDVCKLLILNNIEGLTSKMMIELYTSSRLNCNTHAICSGKAAFSFLALSCHICQTSTLTHAICSGEAAFPFLALSCPEAEQNNNFSSHTHTHTHTHTHAGIVSALADKRHGKDVYESSFKYVLGTLLKVNEKLLADHIAHYRLTSAARTKAWELKAIQSKVSAHPYHHHHCTMKMKTNHSHEHAFAVSRYAGPACGGLQPWQGRKADQTRRETPAAREQRQTGLPPSTPTHKHRGPLSTGRAHQHLNQGGGTMQWETPPWALTGLVCPQSPSSSTRAWSATPTPCQTREGSGATCWHARFVCHFAHPILIHEGNDTNTQTHKHTNTNTGAQLCLL